MPCRVKTSQALRQENSFLFTGRLGVHRLTKPIPAVMTMASRPGNHDPSVAGAGPHDQTWDAVETYFECITTCSLDDGECITRCVDQLRDNDDA